MSVNFFSPNKSITGGALFCTFDSEKDAIYFRLMKQIAFNPDKSNNFDGKNPLNVKLTPDEAADLIRAVRTNGKSSFIHKFGEDTTIVNFSYYSIKSEDPSKSDKQGFGLSVKRSGKTNQDIKVGFSSAAAERLSLFCENALKDIFSFQHSEDIKNLKEYQANKTKPLNQVVSSKSSSEEDNW